MNAETISYLDEVIDETVIASCVSAGASTPALNWLQERPRTYRDLRERSDEWYFWWVENVATPSVLEKLAVDADAGVRCFVARNFKTPEAALERLARDADADVRFHVARNFNTPAAALEGLAGETNAYIRYCVARNGNTPVAELERLARDANADVRFYVARNGNTPVAALERLAGDADADVRRGAKNMLFHLLKRSSHEDETV